jgi:penicillin-binding protein 1C
MLFFPVPEKSRRLVELKTPTEAGAMRSYTVQHIFQKGTAIKRMRLVKRFLIVSAGGFLLFLLLNFIFPLHDKIAYTTIVTDNKGNLVNAFLTPDDKWRMKTELAEISPLLQKTILAKEDKYFFQHPGINPVAIIKALFQNTIHARRASGASTITMQVARALEPRPRNLVSKCIEAFRALQLEWTYSKQEILQLYLNLLPYGGNIEGVKAASLLYFGKAPDHLSLAEITALSIIPNRPSSLVIGKNNALIIQERNKWLRRFATDNIFTDKEITDALSEPLTATRNTVPHAIPHLAYKLKTFSNAHVLATTINLNTQLKIEKLTADYVRTLRLKNIRNAAVMVLDNKTGNVIAYVGSAGFRDTLDGGQVNGAAAVRQPGSTLKPLLYGLCMDAGLLTPKSIINDVPVNYSGYAPENYDQHFNGPVTMEYALEHSLNIPAVRSLQQLGKERMISTLTNAGFKQIAQKQSGLGLSLILGGCGATLEQLTALFRSFANEGVWSAPYFLQNEKTTQTKRLLSPATSYLITETLSQVARPDFPINWTATEHLPKIAWKTGTSYGRRDAWSIGYNKRFTVGVWVGNFSGVGVPELSGANTATPLLFKIFNTIDYNSNSDWYTPPDDCAVRKVCSETGLPPGPNCTNQILDQYLPLVSRTTECSHVEELKISADGTLSYCNSCAPQYGYLKKFYKVVAPEVQDWYRTNHIAVAVPPPHNPDCEKVAAGEGPSITAPLNGSEYYITKSDPEPLQLQARAATDVRQLYWYINDQFYKTTAAGEKLFFVPQEGPVKISCTDDKGRNRNILIRVRYADL